MQNAGKRREFPAFATRPPGVWCDLRKTPLQAVGAVCFMPAVVTETPRASTRTTTTSRSRGRAAAPRCEDCYFRCNLLCALALEEACPTFRPDSPEGLRPARQLRFHFRQPGRTTAAWAFPSATEQAARYG